MFSLFFFSHASARTHTHTGGMPRGVRLSMRGVTTSICMYVYTFKETQTHTHEHRRPPATVREGERGSVCVCVREREREKETSQADGEKLIDAMGISPEKLSHRVPRRRQQLAKQVKIRVKIVKQW